MERRSALVRQRAVPVLVGLAADGQRRHHRIRDSGAGGAQGATSNANAERSTEEASRTEVPVARRWRRRVAWIRPPVRVCFAIGGQYRRAARGRRFVSAGAGGGRGRSRWQSGWRGGWRGGGGGGGGGGWGGGGGAGRGTRRLRRSRRRRRCDVLSPRRGAEGQEPSGYDESSLTGAHEHASSRPFSRHWSTNWRHATLMSKGGRAFPALVLNSK